ncbi:hypothetical protein BDP81DRAFT_103359 [Colletotrichum phormii]|uniref:Uncharacterized protein n=1 Tax=Colletotrichum phormii TaxID=359342 RepID=A0AAJ0EBD2_9PEZI|nr:uncharacterized protein BDP81DRAFT_103359 [Colletotrichum phormii]KAK1624945.1 hypothetical protein BDP81DRAFT_103359 [Colletotrichum phormii]
MVVGPMDHSARDNNLQSAGEDHIIYTYTSLHVSLDTSTKTENNTETHMLSHVKVSRLPTRANPYNSIQSDEDLPFINHLIITFPKSVPPRAKRKLCQTLPNSSRYTKLPTHTIDMPKKGPAIHPTYAPAYFQISPPPPPPLHHYTKKPSPRGPSSRQKTTGGWVSLHLLQTGHRSTDSTGWTRRLSLSLLFAFQTLTSDPQSIHPPSLGKKKQKRQASKQSIQGRGPGAWRGAGSLGSSPQL